MAKHPMLLRRPKARVQSIATYSDSVVATAIAEPSSARAPPRRALLGGRLFRELPILPLDLAWADVAVAGRIGRTRRSANFFTKRRRCDGAADLPLHTARQLPVHEPLPANFLNAGELTWYAGAKGGS